MQVLKLPLPGVQHTDPNLVLRGISALPTTADGVSKTLQRGQELQDLRTVPMACDAQVENLFDVISRVETENGPPEPAALAMSGTCGPGVIGLGIASHHIVTVVTAGCVVAGADWLNVLGLKEIVPSFVPALCTGATSSLAP